MPTGTSVFDCRRRSPVRIVTRSRFCCYSSKPRARITPDMEQQLFTCMRNGFRTTDLVAHLGNLRFVALLPNADHDQAGVVRERIGSALGADDIHLGIACYPIDGTDWASLLHAAESLPSAT